MDGLLLVDKPKEWTSFDVVAKVRSVLNQAQSKSRSAYSSQLPAPSRKVKVGHTGTLDPLATGLLVLTVGSYCKRAQEFSKLDKAYEVEMKLGEVSTTADEEGEKQFVSDRQPAEEELKSALKGFVGQIEQVPPAYSAIKLGGQRAYKLARAGKEVKLEPRKVTIYSIDKIEYDYPFLRFTTHVSSGTYIRSLAVDIGLLLQTGAYLSNLRRTEVGKFSVNLALTVEELSQGTIGIPLLTV